jgi:L-lactate dehydrogenase complex protein LldG
MTTRAEFFGRLRAEVGKAPASFPASVSRRPHDPRAISETIRREMAERWPQALERFRVELERVGGVFHRVATSDAVPGVIARLARERDAHRLVAWHPSTLGSDWTGALTRDGIASESMPLAAVTSAAERARLRAASAGADFGLTGVDLALAETGSMVLRSGPGRPRSTSLLPAYHVAVFDRTALVESLAQVSVFLEAWHAHDDGLGGVINFITGPSRTADIELTLTRGVHGPKEVHAIFVETPLHGDAGTPRG